MADPTFRASTTQDLLSPASITVGKPTGTLSTDVVILYVPVGVTTGGTNAPGTWTAPSGWTAMSGSPFLATNIGGATTRVHLWWALGSVNFSNTFSVSGAVSSQFVGLVCESWQNVDNTTPIDVIGASLSTVASSANLTIASITTVTDRSLQVYACSDNNDGQITTTGFTKVENGASNESAVLNYSSSVKTPAGSTGTVTATSSAGTSGQGIIGIQFALRPASGGGGTPTPQLMLMGCGSRSLRLSHAYRSRRARRRSVPTEPFGRYYGTDVEQAAEVIRNQNRIGRLVTCGH